MESLRLLVADDHEIVRKGLRSLLEAQPGWQVTGEASDGREAVEKAKELKPDVTVLDLVCRLLLEKKEATNRVAEDAAHATAEGDCATACRGQKQQGSGSAIGLEREDCGNASCQYHATPRLPLGQRIGALRRSQ